MEYQIGSPLPGHAPEGAHSAISNKISRPQVTVPIGMAVRVRSESLSAFPGARNLFKDVFFEYFE